MLKVKSGAPHQARATLAATAACINEEQDHPFQMLALLIVVCCMASIAAGCCR
jgi:hypothetical protein